MTIDLHTIPIILIVGIISLYFLVSGIKGLVHKRMMAHNPLADSPPSSVVNVLFNFLKYKVQTDLHINDSIIDKSEYINISGRDLIFRAWFHIIIGLLAMLVLILFLFSESLFNLYDNFFKILTSPN